MGMEAHDFIAEYSEKIGQFTMMALLGRLTQVDSLVFTQVSLHKMFIAVYTSGFIVSSQVYSLDMRYQKFIFFRHFEAHSHIPLKLNKT